jgi:hypothetical protein
MKDDPYYCVCGCSSFFWNTKRVFITTIKKIIKMYKIPRYTKSKVKGREMTEGESIEKKVSRMVHNNEPIKDGAPIIYTERKDGVLAGYNIRTDRWEIAAEAMDKVAASKDAQRDGKFEVKKGEGENPKTKKDGGPESTQGEPEKTGSE